MKKFLLTLIFLNSILIRFFQLGIIPPVINSSSIGLRILSAVENISILMMLYFLTKRLFRNETIALLGAYIFGILPWTIEQSRIASEVNYFLFWFIFLLTISINSRGKIIKVMAILFIPVFLYFTYPSFWLFKNHTLAFNFHNILNNIFILTSFDFLFFRNITFWWGGVREFGIMYLSFLPFFFNGLYQLFINKEKKLLLVIGFITIIAALSPFFPESREFYLVTPFISVISAMGILHWFKNNSINKFKLTAIIIFVLIFIYDFSSFLHYYMVHYPQQVNGNMQNIHGIF